MEKMSPTVVSPPQQVGHEIRGWAVAFVACVVVVVLCMAFVDRPLAEYCDAHFRHTAAAHWIDQGLRPFEAGVFVAFLFLLGCGARTLARRPLPRWTAAPLLCAWALMWAIGAEIILKHLFGRGWVDPTYIEQHQYGFHWLHGGWGWDSFPSGTATLAFAVASVLWMVAPRLRALAVTVATVLVVAVVLVNFHWLSDVVAGMFLGAIVGPSTVRLMGGAKAGD